MEIDKYLQDVDERMDDARELHPSLGRLKLSGIILLNWPSLIMAVLGWGSRIVGLGHIFPSILVISIIFELVIAGSGSFENGLCFYLSLLIVILSSWAVAGVISTIFSMPLSESILSRIEALAKGLQRPLNAGQICGRYAKMAAASGAQKDFEYLDSVRNRIAELEKEDDESESRIISVISKLRRELKLTQSKMRQAYMVRKFTDVIVIFIGSIFHFAMICHIISLESPAAFSPEGAMSYFDSLYFSFTTVTTTDYGDICPVSRFCRFLAIWQQVFGVGFMTVVIGAAVDVFKGNRESLETASSGFSKHRINRRVVVFALSLFRDYQELSKPRHEIIRLLNEVEAYIKKSSLGIQLKKNSSSVKI